LKQFHHAVRTVPEEGNILIHAGGENISELLEMGCWSNTYEIGTKETIQLDLINKTLNFKEEIFDLNSLPFYGTHNYQNALMAIYAAFLNGVHPKDSFAALENFQGVKRRFERIYDDNNIIVIDDFAHHPTAIESTIVAAKDHFDGNILGIIELGSNTMSGGFHGANLHKSANSLDQAFWLNLSGSKSEEHEFTSIDALLNDLKDTLDGFDVILIMSNKDSKKISEPLIELIKKK
jgi:UDP-N-acetylmuramate: L-alanyl-gamma-D-glutamyl-meso-diaminopimelate ligase